MGYERAEICWSSHQRESRSWFIFKLLPWNVVWSSVQCYLCIYLSYLSMQNDLSSTFVFWNPTYFAVVAFLLQEHAGLNAVLAHYLPKRLQLKWGVWSALSSCSVVAGTRCNCCNRAVLKPDQTDRCNLPKWKKKSLKWGIKWTSFYPVHPLASRKRGNVLPLSLRVQFCHRLPFRELPLWLAVK